METKTAVTLLASLAQDARLEVFRLLVQAGVEGLAAGALSERLGIPTSTLSFHLKELSHADLVSSRKTGRFIYYSADFSTMNSLLAYLTENCCGRQSSCAPLADCNQPQSKEIS